MGWPASSNSILVKVDRKTLEANERRWLAPYALKSYASAGRLHREKEHPYRTAFQRDRDRIVHSAAFRRLEYKTQVFVNHEGDYYRTRLTHTIEVNQIARSISNILRVNPDLVEGISLAHDLGHTPFGHAGEDELKSLMGDCGGFDHNLQSLRIVDHLEELYPDFRGLNLTYETRAGLLKHADLFEAARRWGLGKFAEYRSPSMEAQIVDMADEIAYDNHDVDDGLTSGLLQEEDLEKTALWKRVKRLIRCGSSVDPQIRRHQMVRTLINLEATDLIRQSGKNILKFKVRTPGDVIALDRLTVQFGSELSRQRQELRALLGQKLYRHYRVIRMSEKAQRFVKALFEVYLAKPEQLPPGSQRRLKSEGKHRVICDYIAGMTDRYAQDEYRRFFEPFEKV
ncbi:MAG: deoxyguanosinetriphosphate triphosphohydrolase [Candidatus Omnitrophota bacterium]